MTTHALYFSSVLVHNYIQLAYYNKSFNKAFILFKSIFFIAVSTNQFNRKCQKIVGNGFYLKTCFSFQVCFIKSAKFDLILGRLSYDTKIYKCIHKIMAYIDCMQVKNKKRHYLKWLRGWWVWFVHQCVTWPGDHVTRSHGLRSQLSHTNVTTLDADIIGNLLMRGI